MTAVFAGIAHAMRATTSFVVRAVLLLVLLEGTASLVDFALGLAEGLQPPERERLHMHFDPELGWTSIPDTRLESFYGPGRSLTINSQGVRAEQAYAPARPPGRRRALCAGDAFTFGPDVDDDATWCAQLEQIEPTFETVNLGQPGYGLDQIFLRVRRDGAAFDFDVLVVALTRDAFTRMEKDNYHHYAKPVLRIAPTGALEVRNVPVPNTGERMPWLVRNQSVFERLRIVELARPAIRALRPTQPPGLTTGELAELSGKVFGELAQLCAQRGATLALVYLPTYADYENPGELWRARIAREARKREIAFFDLVEELRALPRSDAARLYEPLDPNGLSGREAPLSEAGHAWVAEALRAHLRRLPSVAALLEGPRVRIPATMPRRERPWANPSIS
ncbi:MAG TPA: hypothetical protein VKH41_11755 [Myxococcota bacterium]|nr:hypothetical protein [Myxococcota bacterium]